MKNKPRNRYAFIIDKKLFWHIMVVGGIFCILMVWFTYIMEHADIYPGIQGIQLGSYNGITSYESGLFFTAFVFLQFWNLFNAKAYGTNKSSLIIKNCASFLFIVGLIFVGQLAILYLGGEFFCVEPLEIDDLLRIVVGTSIVLVIGEIVRFFRRSRCHG
jgi:Ca2+-transporting ATPase